MLTQSLHFNKMPDLMGRPLKKCVHLCESINYSFKNIDLLVEAFTHSSAARDLYRRTSGDISVPWNERLEFLGDSVLGLSISTYLTTHPDRYPEGELSKIRAAIVNEKTLADLSRKIGIDKCIVLSYGEEKSFGREKDSLLADAFEALLGAIYLDSDFVNVEEAILRLYQDILSKPLKELLTLDYKSRLQEYTQEHYKEAPSYNMKNKSGPDHRTSFEVEVIFQSKVWAIGLGPSKKQASQDAAKKALEMLLESNTK